MTTPPLPQAESSRELRLGPAGAQRRLVVLHGWGADAHDLLELGPLLVGPEVEVVALQAPWPHPAGMGRQWYNLQQPNWPELPGARAALKQRLLDLSREVALENTILLGFSQGAAMVLDVGTLAEGLDGKVCAALVGCSGYPHPGWDPQTPHKTKVLLTHGEQDPVVPFAASQALQEELQAAGHGVELLGFSGGHTIDESLFPAMKRFIASQWPNPSSVQTPNVP
jgi:phospholipase/carboxylesterase